MAIPSPPSAKSCLVGVADEEPTQGGCSCYGGYGNS